MVMSYFPLPLITGYHGIDIFISWEYHLYMEGIYLSIYIYIYVYKCIVSYFFLNHMLSKEV